MKQPPRNLPRARSTVLALVIVIAGCAGQPADTDDGGAQGASDAVQIDDLAMALTLQGVDCGDVVDLEQPSENVYEVKCKRGGVFSLGLGADGELSIVNLVSEGARAGVAGLGQLLTVPGKVLLGASREAIPAATETARHLFGIVRVAGHACAEVTSVERLADEDHIVHCSGEMSYRVYSNPDGLVMVDALTMDPPAEAVDGGPAAEG